MKFREQPKAVLKQLNARLRNNGVFNTQYTLEELERELSQRERVIRKIEKKAEKNHNRKKRYLKKAADSMNQRKVRFAAKAKEAEMHKSFFSELFDNMMAQYLFLTKLVIEAKQRRVYEAPMEEFGFNVNIDQMNVDAVTNALENSSMKQAEVSDTIDEIQMEIDTADRSGITLDLEEIKQEADMLSASDIESDSFDVGGEWNDAIDEQIEAELDRLEDDQLDTENTS